MEDIFNRLANITKPCNTHDEEKLNQQHTGTNKQNNLKKNSYENFN